MIYGAYQFYGIFKDKAILPEYKGSTFRGVFGHALKKVVCALKIQDCRDCLLKNKCIYSFVFEAPAENVAVTGKKRIAAPPNPYVIEPPETNQAHFTNGDQFSFILILFGKANDYLPYFICAMDQMGKEGIGRKVNGSRGTFDLMKVTSNNATIYTKEEGKIKMLSAPEESRLTVDDPYEGSTDRSVEIELITPLRLKYENRLEASLPFHILIRAALRRISSLCNHYGNGEPPLDYRGLVRRAEDVAVTSTTLHWVDWKRYSNRQEQAMLMGGMIGKVAYRGYLNDFIPLLRFCEKVHIGKQSSFGLGKIRVNL